MGSCFIDLFNHKNLNLLHSPTLRRHILILFYFISDIKSVQGQRVDTQPRNVTALEGEKADILCRWGKPLQYCR